MAKSEKQFESRFFEWQNLAHYLLLDIFLSAALYYLFHIIITPKLFAELYLVLFVGDTLTHFVFWNLPEKYRWRD